MSTILDALKKSQAAQRGDEVALRLTQGQQHRWPTWIGIAIVIALAANGALLGWGFLRDSQTPEPPRAANSDTTDDARLDPMPVAADPQKLVVEEQAPSDDAPDAPETTLSAADSQPPTAEAPTPLVIAPPTQFALDELASDERALFDGFSYTTHIYTDDPALCAIVINGQRLQAGDTFEARGIVGTRRSRRCDPRAVVHRAPYAE